MTFSETDLNMLITGHKIFILLLTLKAVNSSLSCLWMKYPLIYSLLFLREQVEFICMQEINLKM